MDCSRQYVTKQHSSRFYYLFVYQILHMPSQIKIEGFKVWRCEWLMLWTTTNDPSLAKETMEV